jgi:predicted nucleic acid-binding protein
MPNLWKRVVCVDSSFVLQLLIEASLTPQAESLWAHWHQSEVELIAPTLLYYELCNVLHQYVRRNALVLEEAQAALDIAIAFEIKFYGDIALHQQAARLAHRLQLPATYDAHYLALCERFSANFWTADKRLYNSVHDALPWVYSLQDYELGSE